VETAAPVMTAMRIIIRSGATTDRALVHRALRKPPDPITDHALRTDHEQIHRQRTCADPEG
jgi:hypothetical protein